MANSASSLLSAYTLNLKAPTPTHTHTQISSPSSSIFKERLKYLNTTYPSSPKRQKLEFNNAHSSHKSSPSGSTEFLRLNLDERLPIDKSKNSHTHTHINGMSPHSPTPSTHTQAPLKTSLSAELNSDNEITDDLCDRFEPTCCLKSCKNDVDKRELLTCAKCKKSLHTYCCDPPLRYTLVARYSWCCPDCKACTICGSNKQEETMLICDSCDRAYHMECMEPPVEQVPDEEWLCLECSKCNGCGRALNFQELQTNTIHSYGKHLFCNACYNKYFTKTSKRGKSKIINKFDEDDSPLCSACLKLLNTDTQAYFRCAICNQNCHEMCISAKNDSIKLICFVCQEFQRSFQPSNH